MIQLELNETDFVGKKMFGTLINQGYLAACENVGRENQNPFRTSRLQEFSQYSLHVGDERKFSKAVKKGEVGQK